MSRRFVFLSLILSLFVSGIALAQERDRSRDSQSRESDSRGRDRGNWDPAAMRERFLGTIKEQLSASDDEWKVLSPKVSKVMDVQRESRSSSGGYGFFSSRSSRSRDESEGSLSPVARASRDLRQALENKDASAEEIAGKLTALREAKDKAKADLQVAQKDLKDVLTQRQEAVLVTMGILD